MKNKKTMTMNMIITLVISMLFLVSNNATAQYHPPNEIAGGNFSYNNFEFPLNLYVNQSLTLRNGNLDVNNNALLNIDWSTSDDGSGSGLDADTIDNQNYNSNWPTTQSNIQSALSNDFHNIGGTDDDVPEAGDFGAATDLDANGNVADDSHNHIYSNIDATTSANWAGRITDETGTGNIVFSNSPSFTTPSLGIASASRVYISDYGYALGGFHVGGSSDPGTDNLVVDGTITCSDIRGDGISMAIGSGSLVLGLESPETSVAGYMEVADYVLALGGIHIGGTSDPGTDNLVVDGHVSVGGAFSGYQMVINGDVNTKPGYGYRSSGTCVAGGCTSDIRLKENITYINDSLNRILELEPITFVYKNESEGPTNVTSYGLIAQDVQEIFPEWILEKEEYLGVMYGQNIPMHLIKAIKELKEQKDEEINQLNDSNHYLQTEVENLKSENIELRAAICQLDNSLEICSQ